MTKYLIFDAGPIISLTMNGLLGVLEKLKNIFDGEFIITPQVKYEVVERPAKTKKYELESVMVQDLIDKGIFTMSSKIIPNNSLEKETKNILKIINGCFSSEKQREKINLIQNGEASCLAFAKLCKCENLIVVDERTTRMLVESPEELKDLMERKLHNKIILDKTKLKEIKNFRFIRSAELLFVAYKKNLFDMKKNRQLLDALLYGVKFKGTAISSKEIEEIKRLV